MSDCFNHIADPRGETRWVLVAVLVGRLLLPVSDRNVSSWYVPMKIYKGDMVKVTVSTEKLVELERIDPESYYYLKDRMDGVGQVYDITVAENGMTTYHVNFGKEIGMFYPNEVTLVS